MFYVVSYSCMSAASIIHPSKWVKHHLTTAGSYQNCLNPWLMSSTCIKNIDSSNQTCPKQHPISEIPGFIHPGFSSVQQGPFSGHFWPRSPTPLSPSWPLTMVLRSSMFLCCAPASHMETSLRKHSLAKKFGRSAALRLLPKHDFLAGTGVWTETIQIQTVSWDHPKG